MLGTQEVAASAAHEGRECAAQPGVTSPIIGPNSVAQLEDNLAASDVTITDEDKKRVDELVQAWDDLDDELDRVFEESMADGKFGVFAYALTLALVGALLAFIVSRALRGLRERARPDPAGSAAYSPPLLQGRGRRVGGAS